jgi:3-phosphoshikimate 1-carboxyvinyltransferase
MCNSPGQPDDPGAPLRGPLSVLADPLGIPTLSRAFDVTIRPPGSKSITNRALLLAALARGTSTLRGALVDADDAAVMRAALTRLGATVERDPDGPTTVRVTGVDGRWRLLTGDDARLNLHNAGTATRFLTGAGLLAPPGASVTIDGSARMRQRPIGELVDVMRSIGGRVEYLGTEGFPPLRVWGMDGGAGVATQAARFGQTSSGQFISAMLMAAPWLPGRVGLVLTKDPTSAPYIEMTRQVMLGVGFRADAARAGEEGFRLAAPQTEQGRSVLPAFTLDVEPDASGASYLWGAAAIVPGARCRVDGLGLRSIQGDTEFVSALDAMGADVRGDSTWTSVTGPATLRGADIDLADMPDTAMTAAVVALFATPTPDNPTATTTLRGLRTLRVKETDRLAALQTELTKVGATVEIVAESGGRGGGDESLRITPPADLLGTATCLRPSFPRVEFDTYNDHRMAMALALVGLRRPNVWIRDPGCVAKTYPGYFADLAKVYR